MTVVRLVVYPTNEATTVCSPVGTLAIVYSPSTLVAAPSVGLPAMRTLTPGSPSPEVLSVTTPRTVPVACAEAASETARSASTSAARGSSLDMVV